MGKQIGKSLRPPARRVGPLAAWLKARERTGVHTSVAELAKSLGCSRAHANGLLDGTRKPGLELAVAIEEYTGGAVGASEWIS